MSKMNFTGLVAKMCAAAIVAAAFSVTGSAAARAQGEKPSVHKTPAPKILVIDRSAILRGSKVGEDIRRQVKAYTEAAEKEFKGEDDHLKSEQEKLQQQLAILSADQKQKKIAAFQKEQQAFQKKVQERQDEIQGGVMQADRQVEKALGPILRGIMAERDANLLMDRSAVILGTVDVDVTGLAIDRLNNKMSAVKVDLVEPKKNDNDDSQQ